MVIVQMSITSLEDWAIGGSTVNGSKLKQKFSDLAGVTEKLHPSMLEAAIKHVFLMLVSAMLS